jgi:DNA-binding NarL/FixJ family response regulator
MDELPAVSATEPADVVVIDAPDGASAANAARRARESGVVAPILILTAGRARGLNEQVGNAGVQGTMLKTGSVGDLLTALRTLADGKVSFDRRYPPRPAGQSPLSRREQEILRLVAQGATNREIAEALGIGAETVKTALARASAKLGVRGRTQLVAAAHGLGLL